MENKNLEELQSLIEQNKSSEAKAQKNIGLKDLFLQSITSENLQTMAISYSELEQKIKLQLIINTALEGGEKVYYYKATPQDYLSFCESQLGIDIKRKYNDSVNRIYDNYPTRIFAIMPPYKDYPLVVLSTAKQPKNTLDTLNPEDERRLAIAMEGNVLITGQSGSGKTFLLNYLLHKYTPKTERIGIVQEFSEIFPPNELTDTILTPPKTPGQPWNDLEIIVEQTNLMRYDRVIVGEIKGSEAWPFVINCASGTKGTATLHGSSAQKALQRLKTLCLSASSNLSSDVINGFIKDAIDYVVYVEDHYVKEVMRLHLANRGNFSLEAVGV